MEKEKPHKPAIKIHGTRRVLFYKSWIEEENDKSKQKIFMYVLSNKVLEKIGKNEENKRNQIKEK